MTHNGLCTHFWVAAPPLAPQPRLYEHVSPSLRSASGPTLQPVLGGQVGSRTALHPNPAPYLSSQSLSFPDCKLAGLAQGVAKLGSHRPAQLCHMGKDDRLLGSFTLLPLLADTTVQLPSSLVGPYRVCRHALSPAS